MSWFASKTKAFNNSSLGKRGAKAVNTGTRNVSRMGKTLKKIFTGEGEMMKLYNQLTAFYDAGDVRGLESFKNHLVTYQPGFGSGKQEKKAELLSFAEVLLASLQGKNVGQQAKNLMASINTRHEIGRRIKADLFAMTTPTENTESVNINMYSGPMGFNYAGYEAAKASRRKNRKTRRRN